MKHYRARIQFQDFTTGFLRHKKSSHFYVNSSSYKWWENAFIFKSLTQTITQPKLSAFVCSKALSSIFFLLCHSSSPCRRSLSEVCLHPTELSYLPLLSQLPTESVLILDHRFYYTCMIAMPPKSWTNNSGFS